jgi:hypothetical protein
VCVVPGYACEALLGCFQLAVAIVSCLYLTHPRYTYRPLISGEAKPLIPILYLRVQGSKQPISWLKATRSLRLV